MKQTLVVVVVISFVLVAATNSTSTDNELYKFDKSKLNKQKNKIKEMFYHAYDNYIYNAYPYDELKPITCEGFDTWGSYSLTLIDSLDMLVILNNRTEFERVVDLLVKTIDFNKDINVSVFETNIRIVGGLISAHLLSYRLYLNENENMLNIKETRLDTNWPCDGPLLRLAVKAAQKILPAFNTSTGMPYGTVNLRYGVPQGETTETCVAGVGTFLVEFAALSRLTGDPVYEQVASRALDALWQRRSAINLVGNHINVLTGKWTAQDATIGSGVDSYFEYLVKGGILLNRPELIEQFQTYERAIFKYLSFDDWFLWANMNRGHKTLPLFSSLDSFYPGVLTLTGNLEQAIRTAKKYHEIWRQYGSLPEFYNVHTRSIHSNRETYPLRPELIESVMYILRATNYDAAFLEMAHDYLNALDMISKVDCGFATVKDVRDHTLENRMESFFLAETLKYLYLIFDADNFLHNDLAANSFKLIRNELGECSIGTGYYIFNTEAHPIDGACLACCLRLNKAKFNEQASIPLSDDQNEQEVDIEGLDLDQLLDRYAQLNLYQDNEEKSTSSMLYNENRFDRIDLTDQIDELIRENENERFQYEEEKSRYCNHIYGLNETQAEYIKVIDESVEASKFGHFYSFRCSLNSTFKLRLGNYYTQSYFP